MKPLKMRKAKGNCCMQKKTKIALIISSVIVVAGITGVLTFLITQNSNYRSQYDALSQSLETLMTSTTEEKTTQESTTETTTAPTTETTGQQTEPQTVYAVVTAEPSLNLRKEPDVKADKLASLKTETVVELLRYQDDSKEWAYVYVPSEEKNGWVSAKYLEIRVATPETQPVSISEQSTGSYGTEEWIKVSCPLCNGGRNLEVCSVCKGEGNFNNLIRGSTKCPECSYKDHDGFLCCSLCKCRFYIKMRNYEVDLSVPKPAELAAKVKALGPEPLYKKLCTYCNGGTKLKKCPNWTEGEKHRCSECYDGYIKCTHCDYGFIKNENYKVEQNDWNLKFDAIIRGVVEYEERSEADKLADLMMASNYLAANERVARDYDAAAANSAVGGGNSSSGSGSSLCKHCYGLRTCPRCNGSGWMKNGYTGETQRCSTCGGSKRCPYCNG